MSAPKTPFSALRTEHQEQIKHLIAPMTGEFQCDIRFTEGGAYIVPSTRGYILEELRTWSECVDTRDEDLSTENLALRAKLKGLEADMRGTMLALKDCQERLESIKGILA
jgi:hypothetical protein